MDSPDAAPRDRPLRFGLIGAGGYIARKHFRAIAAIGGELLAICDVHETVGDVEPYFPQARLYLRQQDFWYACASLDYVVVCTPNYLHFGHCRRALWAGCDVICEKPVTLSLESLDELALACETTGQSIHPILQLRYDLGVRTLFDCPPPAADVEMRYWARRGLWYDSTWKGDLSRSGGLVFNLAIHGFDVLCRWLGKPEGVVARADALGVHGYVNFEHNRVEFSVSRDPELLGKKRFDRGVFVGGERICDLGTGNPGLHEATYRAIVAGHGLKLSDARTSIELCEKIERST